MQPRSQELSPTRLSLPGDGSGENPGNEVDISCILAVKRHFSNVACISVKLNNDYDTTLLYVYTKVLKSPNLAV